ncbi:hypothetical protein LOTGIDRAFT_161450 [Lottia gigantea]|uniref:Saposin B-type domain-containing protein n=1 Tax=Lottia gigantea TaxID=225164 RepID=V4BYM2_LOTGI|nr:hypothetical protein LOTGIDRAFT_161450 [Lottia gigantea]ESO94239.1 hypothetical protein LOTGIDRAFT_161450 [Lottia gigantea]
MKVLYLIAFTSCIYHSIQHVIHKRDDEDCNFCVQVVRKPLPVWFEFVQNTTIKPEETCTTFCSQLPDIRSALVCDLYCPQYQLHNFIDFIKGSYNDPIFYCQQAKECFGQDGGMVHVVNATLFPNNGSEVYRFLELRYEITKPINPGQYKIMVKTVDGFPVHMESINTVTDPGLYAVQFFIQTSRSASCHPEVKPCETWVPGRYVVDYKLCGYECDSKAPTREDYFQGQESFIIDQV